MNNIQRPAAVDRLVDELLTCGGVMTQIIDHMARFSAAGLSSPDAPPITVVLHGLMSEVLSPALETREPGELQEAASILHEINEAIAAEIILVSPEAVQDQV